MFKVYTNATPTFIGDIIAVISIKSLDPNYWIESYIFTPHRETKIQTGPINYDSKIITLYCKTEGIELNSENTVIHLLQEGQKQVETAIENYLRNNYNLNELKGTLSQKQLIQKDDATDLMRIILENQFEDKITKIRKKTKSNALNEYLSNS